MTRDEIMALSADELRVKIAKAKGWIVGNGPMDSASLRNEHGEYAKWWRMSDGRPITTILNWTGDIQDAWVLFLEMVAGDAGASISGRENESIDCVIVHPILFVVNEPTAEMAISRMWMIWNEERKQK